MTTTVENTRSRLTSGLALATAAWDAAVVAASTSGALGAMAKVFMPAYAGLVALGIAVPTALYFTLPTARRAVDALGLRRLTLFHVWRIPASVLW